MQSNQGKVDAESTLRPSLSDLQESREFSSVNPLALAGGDLNSVKFKDSVWRMAYAQNDRAVSSLKGLLVADYGGKKLSIDSELVLHDVVLALSFSAREHDEAYLFLLARTDPETWMESKSWKSELGDYSADALTSVAIQGLGISGRQDAGMNLKALSQKSPKYLHRFAGDIVQAHFYRHVRDTSGENGLWSQLLSQDREQFREWIKSPEGKELSEWANTVMRGPEPGKTKIEALSMGDAQSAENYVLLAGVVLTDAIEAKVKKIADTYNTKTGKKITVTSGTRTAESQATAMYVKLAAGSDLSEYKDQTSAKEIKKSYDDGKAAGKTKDQIIADMTTVIKTQIAAGKYISKHLKAGAVDIRSRDMSEDEKKEFRSAAEAVAVSVLLESTPPHWHLQF
jgi:hypothetical protein